MFVPNLRIKYQIFQQCKKPEIESKMKDFECATEDGIKKLFGGSSSKSCDPSSILTRVLKNCLDILITPITDEINISMETSSSTFLQNFKDAHIRPPVKNILQITLMYSTNRLQPHIQYSHVSDPLKSAYRKQHSIESALLKVHIVSMDKGEVTTLTLSDLSAAVDNKPEYLTDFFVRPKCSKYLHSTNSNRFFVHLETKTGSRAFAIV